METITIVGDPKTIGNFMINLHKNNPDLKIISLAVAPWIESVPGSKLLGQQQMQQMHVLYITFEGPDLINEKGELIQTGY